MASTENGPGEKLGGVIAWFTGNPVAANLLMVLTIALGIGGARDLPRESFPGMEPSVITVTVAFPSGSPEVAEEAVVLPLEQVLRGTPGLKRVSSVARVDGATLTLEKELGADLDGLLAEVKARIDTVPNLPPRAERPVLRKARPDDLVIWAQVSGDAVGREVLERVAHDLWRELSNHPDIDRVERVGSLGPEIHVEIDDATLAEYGLSLADVASAIDDESLIDLSGSLRGPGGEVTLRAARRARWAADVAQIPLRAQSDGGVLRIGDLGRVTPGFAETPRRAMRFDGETSIGLRAFKDVATSSDEVSRAVLDIVEGWRAGARLPRGVHLETWHDRSRQITARIELLQGNALTGMLLVFGVLALTLDLRIAFWVAMGLPVAFSGAFLTMGVFGLSLNDLTIFGMIVALGIIVDDAVVVGESIHSAKLQEGNSLGSAVRGVHRVAVPTVFGVLTTVTAFAVLGLVEGEFGTVFAQFALVTAGCLLLSIAESKLILPAHLAPLRLGERESPRGGRRFWAAVPAAVAAFFGRLVVAYRSLLGSALRRRYLSLGAILLVTAGSLGLVAAGVVRSSFFPEIPGELVTASVTMEESAGYGLTEDNLGDLERALERAASRVGSPGGVGPVAAVQTHMTGDRTGVIQVELSPDSGVAPGALADAWRLEAGALEGAKTLTVSASFDDNPPISLEIRARGDDTLAAASRAVAASLRRTDGVHSVRDRLAGGRAELDLRLTAEGRALGLDTAELSDQLQRAYLGYEVQRFHRGGDEVRVRVRYPPSERRDAGDFRGAHVRTPSGEVVPLTLVAASESRRSASEITRAEGQRVAIVDAFVDRDVTSPEAAMADFEATALPDLQARFPGLTLTQRGELEEIAETSESIGWMLLLALACIYGLIAVPLRSYVQPVLIMAVIPFGVLGAIFGHWLHGLTLSILSFFGLLALAGIVVNDSLLLVATFNVHRRAGAGPIDAWMEAGGRRLRAICLTSVTTFVGLLPLILERSEFAQYLIPAAVSIAYGLVASTAITLVILPVFQMIAEDVRSAFSRRRRV